MFRLTDIYRQHQPEQCNWKPDNWMIHVAIDIYNMRSSLEQAGLVYLDSLNDFEP